MFAWLGRITRVPAKVPSLTHTAFCAVNATSESLTDVMLVKPGTNAVPRTSRTRRTPASSDHPRFVSARRIA